MATSIPDLTPEQQRVLTRLATCSNIRKIAREEGVGHSTVYSWFRDPHFVEIYRQTVAEVWEHSLCEIKIACSKAIHAMVALLKNEDPKIVLEAAKEILSGSYDAELALQACIARRMLARRTNPSND